MLTCFVELFWYMGIHVCFTWQNEDAVERTHSWSKSPVSEMETAWSKSRRFDVNNPRPLPQRKRRKEKEKPRDERGEGVATLRSDGSSPASSYMQLDSAASTPREMTDIKCLH